MVRCVRVFARANPMQKEEILSAMREGPPASASVTTLMCGDGTNDVGALKCAHVGVSIISAPALENKQSQYLQKRYELRKLRSNGKRDVKGLHEQLLALDTDAQSEVVQLEMHL